MDSSKGRRGAAGDGYGYRANGSYGSGYGHGNSPYGYGSYGYSYGNYGYGSGGGASVVERTIKDYLLIIRERRWYIVLGFLLVVGATAVFSVTRTPLYLAIASVQIYRRAPSVMQSQQQVVSSEIASTEDLNTQVNILKSRAIMQSVAQSLTGTDRELFLQPYEKSSGAKPDILYILQENREIEPERLSLVVSIEYKHPNKFIAAKVANLFADAYIAYNATLQVDESMKAIEELDRRANAQRKRVDDIAAAIQAYREKNNSVSLDSRQDIVTESLKDANKEVMERATALAGVKSAWMQVQQIRRAHGNLLDLPFIASDKNVQELESRVAEGKITVAELGQRYRAKFPAMVRAQRALDEAEAELDRALQTAAAQAQEAYQNALENFTQAVAARDTQVKQSLDLGRYGLEYSNLQRDFEVNEKLLEQILDVERSRQTESNVGAIENQNARIVDRAIPPRKRYYPSYLLNFGLGTFGGLIVGFTLAFSVAYMDDRIKSAFDIETVVGLPIIGIIPEVRKLGDLERMKETVASHPDREVTEAFSALMSALQLKEESKAAQCLLVTSTIAGEGKSFIATHLAETYASHGERVVVVDCDLRRPAVNRVFHLENLKGVIDVCGGHATLDEVIHHNVRPNLDVIVTGGRSKSPTQTLNSKEFALMISELRKRYTKIFVDTPPIAIVTDALIVLPQVDGSLYSIFFNKVRRKAAQFCAQRLRETNVPNFGAVLNALPGGVGGYYYSHYYDKSYKDYYIKAGESAAPGEKIAEDDRGVRR